LELCEISYESLKLTLGEISGLKGAASFAPYGAIIEKNYKKNLFFIF